MESFALCLLALMSSGMLVAAETRHTIELLVVLDKTGYTNWIGMAGTPDKIEEEVRAILRDVTDSFSSLQKYNMYIDVRVKKIVYEEHTDIAGGSPTSVLPNIALLKFKQYLRSKYIFDHATLITGKYIGANMGYSKVGAMCGINSMSVISAVGTYVVAVIWAHEIGHSLGANHDDGQPGCEESIMTAVTYAQNRNRGTFSDCSCKEISTKLPSYECLIGTNLTENTSPRLGQIITQDQLCQRYTKTETSKALNEFNNMKPKQCLEIFCSRGSNMRTYHQTDGATCGQNKICLLSKCVNTPSTYYDKPIHCPVERDMDHDQYLGGQ